jgi:hypothetical protein
MNSRLSLAVLVLTAVALPSCKCITVPAQDSVRPRATLTVTFMDSDASGPHERTVTITSADLGNPPVLRIPMSRSYTVIYSGSDDGGVRRLVADYQYSPSTSGALIAVPSIPSGEFGSCAMTTRTLSFDWQVFGRATIQVKAVDFHGNEANTPTLEIAPE